MQSIKYQEKPNTPFPYQEQPSLTLLIYTLFTFTDYLNIKRIQELMFYVWCVPPGLPANKIHNER